MPTVRWLHISDLHVGMREQGWLWPRYGNQLDEDLGKIWDKSGPWDAVLFSGDLVDKGKGDEFNRLDEILGRIWVRFGQLGCNPVLVTVPGNHDLSRSDLMAPEMIAFEQFWRKAELRDALWKEESVYKAFIDQRFEAYMSWRERSIASGRHLKPLTTGIFPGDAAYSFRSDGTTIGIVALNSTWLQLGAGDYKGLLHVDPRQLMAVTAGDPDTWTSGNSVNFLMTHQPTDWLHSDSLTAWESEIAPTGRFDLHLFGHMHEPSMTRIARGGSSGRRNAQAASLFGLERLSDGSTQRIQGYAAFNISKEESRAVVRCWPRIVITTGDRDRKLAADTSQDLEEDNSFSFEYNYTRILTPPSSAEVRPIEMASRSKALETETYDVDGIRVYVNNIQAHRLVRNVEQVAFVKDICERGASWLVADWGMAAKEFIASTLVDIGVAENALFRLDCSEYRDRESFLVRLGASLGSSFENIVTAISNYGASAVILDDVPLAIHASDSGPSLSTEIEKLVDIIQDYAPAAKIVIRSRVSPLSAALPIVTLHAFEEPDLAIYIRESDQGDPRYSKPDAVGVIFRRTDGVPARVDDALRDLQVTSLADLAATNPDFADNALISIEAPTSLIMAVGQIQSSQDVDAPRAYELLLALSALPYGEQLSRIRRFLGVHPFSTNHARYLLDRGLLSSVTLNGFGENDNAEQVRALTVPRIVREYVISTMSEERSKAIDAALVTMYFGRKWNEGDIENSPTGRRARNPLSDGYEISNATTLILRMLLRARANSDALGIETLLRLAGAFIAALLRGNHYRNVATFIDDIAPVIDEEQHERTYAVLMMQRARALRMLGKIQQALDCSMAINLQRLTKDQRQEVIIGRSLAHERLDHAELAAEAAREAIRIAPKSSRALHAKLVLAEQITDQAKRILELKSLLIAGRRKKADVLVNNVLISLANEPNTSIQVEQLQEVVESARVTRDFWNVARATITLAEIAESGADVSLDHRNKLVEAYHFLHAERLPGLFDRCHEALWRVFEDTGDTENLLNLFRHSSFIWRLAGRDDKELRYLRKLAGNISTLVMSNIPNIEQDKSYFMVRVSVIIGSPEAGGGGELIRT